MSKLQGTTWASEEWVQWFGQPEVSLQGMPT